MTSYHIEKYLDNVKKQSVLEILRKNPDISIEEYLGFVDPEQLKVFKNLTIKDLHNMKIKSIIEDKYKNNRPQIHHNNQIQKNSTMSWTNARVKSINIGSKFHDYNTFMSINFEFDDGVQGVDFDKSFDIPMVVDRICDIFDILDLMDIKGKYCQIKRKDGIIIGFKHLINSDNFWIFR